MKMQQKMMFKTNDFKIYDIIAHRSYIVNRNDIDIASTVKYGYPYVECIDCKKYRCGYALIYTYNYAKKKTPNYLGRFAVSDKTYEKITTIPRKNW